MARPSSGLSAETLIRRNHELLVTAETARQTAERLVLQVQARRIEHCLRARSPLEWPLAVGTGRRPNPVFWQAAAIARRASARAAARRHRAARSVPGASRLNANQLWKCASALRALTTVCSVEQRAEMMARADRVEGLGWDRALRRQLTRADLT
jgi:hypothetical protein